MRIGLITFHASYNFGSSLQAYAMQETVSKLGHECTVIDFLSRDQKGYGLLSPFHPKRNLRILRKPCAYLKRRSSFKAFSKSYFRLTEKQYSYKDETMLTVLQKDFDCFVCGSDQIWNLDCTKGVVEPFFLSFTGNKPRVAYAPSLAHTEFKQKNFDKEKVARLLADFDFLSMREEETLPLFQPLVDKPIDVVLDPTLLLDANDYEPIISKPPVNGDYIFIYLLRKCPDLLKSTIAIARETGKKVVYVSEKNLPIPNSENLFGVGPSEFLSLIANADNVMANSFHAAVFSVLFHKPFRIFATDKSSVRIMDLLLNLGIEERCVDCEDSSEIAEVDWADVDGRLIGLRKHSFDYLDRAFNQCRNGLYTTSRLSTDL
ncbi:MAG: polysaccharide pyruvyl transferase family protein [Phoenicibacter congonensis]|uniref:Polysaccharide pyruvyl transferase family protein n=1 Tax=Phoenicibacter congonensis TaxID=1944646 RepID=A0AA43RFW9_9ACTN|nr:polysaccharide pyruvyl transferase family protein [Phoenicibacter congonensis]